MTAALPPVALSSASVYPEGCTAAFEAAAELGYDGVEVMVWDDPVSQSASALERLSAHYRVPVLSVHAPTLLLTQRVWGTDPWVKIERSYALAEQLGAGTVVIHPPFRWQRDYARTFVQGLAERQQRTEVALAVENMFPWRARGRLLEAYAPGWDPVQQAYPHLVLDLSHTATAGVDALSTLDAMGRRLGHLHLADGSGSRRDEHLVPGRGTQPCAEVLALLGHGGFAGTVVVEVNTRRAPDRAARRQDLEEALAFARDHLARGRAG
ncbi:sugar phosphate isomerase/epimerase family protein [Motilibacter aurantiacus]|uniref:sugar phosphate isomerase/epimerase family protein n=1 Tax=Motilibacter aurantiacus TaxID=2714955 RepID=UPI00140E5507|nr:sugar phosphate isomerase/epimerase [Motilibacter aurantiacus]